MMFWLSLLSAMLFGLAGSAVGDVVVYDAGLGTTPGSQGWLAFLDSNSTQSINNGRLELDTTADFDERSGYFSESTANGAFRHPGLPNPLDANIGFGVQFDLQVLSEQHANRDDNGDGLDDRAGFSLIVISNDLTGLELAFFEDRIWAYADASEGANSLFTQAEGVDFDTTAVTQYELNFSASGYRLLADGQQVLSGQLRNYNPSGVEAPFNPYDNPNFVFWGDNTRSASAQVSLSQMTVTAIPEPAGLIPMALIAATGWARRRRPPVAQSR